MKKTKILGVAVVMVVAQVVSSCAHKPTTTASNPPATHAPVVSAAEQRAPSSTLDGTPWTDWSTKNEKYGALVSQASGLLVLKHIRENLLEKNLHDPNANYEGYGPAIDCNRTNTKFRSADGTCNDVDKPYVGAAKVAFGRNVPPEFIDANAGDRLMTPNPSLVSKEFFTRDEFKPVPFLNMLAAVWIQFMNHDWLTHGRNMDSSPLRVPTDKGTVSIERTKENSVRSSTFKPEFGNKVTLNEVTHWWDGSQIYGSSQEVQDELRSHELGKMKTVVVNGREILPKNDNLNVADNKQNQGYEMTGFKDNWWVGLSMLHTLFVKEHNAVADLLFKNHVKPDPKVKGRWLWTNEDEVTSFDSKQLDEQIFQTARLINSAILAKIHTVEWTPAILPNPTLRRAMCANWYGAANPNCWAKIITKLNTFKKTKVFEDAKLGYLIGGIVGDKTDKRVPFSITEEFTSVYRLHSLLPETLNFRRMNDKANVNAVPFMETRNDKSYEIMSSYDFKDLFYSFGTQLPGQLVLNNFPKFMQDLTVPGHGSLDMGMVDVLRDRERGVPRYNQFRRAINLIPIKSYKDFFPSNKPLNAKQLAIVDKFNRVYGKDANGNDNVELIDLLVGTLAEEVRPKNYGFGETQFQIFILMASRRLMTDRFFTESYRKENYTKTGLNWIDQQGTFAQVIARHMPELKSRVKGLDSAFYPWKD